MRLLPVPEPLQLVGLGGRERWRAGQMVSIWSQPLWQQEGRGRSDMTGRPKSASKKGGAGMPTLRSSVEGWGILCPIPTKNLRSLIHLLKERLSGHKWGQVPEHPALFRINRPDLMWPA